MLKSFPKAIGLAKKNRLLNEWKEYAPLTYSIVTDKDEIFRDP